MRETLGVTLGGMLGLGQSEDQGERAVDRIAALGASQALTEQDRRVNHAAEESFLIGLGGDLIALKYGRRTASKVSAQANLAQALSWKRLRLGLTDLQRDRISWWAIREWTIDACTPCMGSGKVAAHDVEGLEGAQPMETCPTCQGAGKRRYDDAERIQALGHPFAEAMESAHRLISTAEGLATANVLRKVGREKS